MNKSTTPPAILNKIAHEAFVIKAKELGFDPYNQWVGKYVDYIWCHERYSFMLYMSDINEKQVLEFGCNMGASSIVLALMGAKVTAIDVNKDYIELARLNAQRYGVENNINFMYLEDTLNLPFDNTSFDLISCNSVLEYIPDNDFKQVIEEIDRVLKQDALLLINATSSKLWPREVHSGRWFINYLPTSMDRWLAQYGRIERGVNPFYLNKLLKNYTNMDIQTQGKLYYKSKKMMSDGKLKLFIINFLTKLLKPLNLSIGIIMPSFFLPLKKYKI